MGALYANDVILRDAYVLPERPVPSWFSETLSLRVVLSLGIIWIHWTLTLHFSDSMCQSAFSYKLLYIVGLGLVEMAISTNMKPTIYHNLHENTGPDVIS